jgi:hypothetical protein
MSPSTDFLLSICIPTFNRSRFLREAIGSIFRGLPLELGQRLEVIVSDNCSSDDTPQVVAELRTQHQNIRAIRNSENIGFDGNYRASILAARGRFTMTLGRRRLVRGTGRRTDPPSARCQSVAPGSDRVSEWILGRWSVDLQSPNQRPTHVGPRKP